MIKIKLLDYYKIDRESYMRKIFKRTSQIMVSHNIHVNICQMIFLNEISSPNASREDDIQFYLENFFKDTDTCNVDILFTDMQNLKNKGMAYVNTICSYSSVGLVDISFELSFNSDHVGAGLAHELMHILGGEHVSDQLIAKSYDEKGNCSCHHLDKKYCVTYRGTIKTYIFIKIYIVNYKWR
ncbi:hypothetical protein HZS_7314, partial [Henneguya salminicola]